jgi:hypothetical protein
MNTTAMMKKGMKMDKETLEIITDIADMKGFYEERSYEFYRFINALIDSSSLAYNRKNLCIDNERFTALLMAYANEEVKDRISTLIETQNEGDEDDG